MATHARARYRSCLNAIGCPLSTRELQALRAVASGASQKKAARELGITHSTIRTILARAAGRLEVTGTAQAVIYCFKAGWLDVDVDAPEQTATIADLDRLARVLEDLVELIKHRRRVTERQRVYLDAFDQLLAARTDEDRAHARLAMNDALGPLLEEAGIPPGLDRPRRDLVEVIASLIHRN